MAVTLYHTGTEYTSNALTFLRGSVTDVTSVGVYHTTNLTYIPLVSDFTTVTLANGTGAPPDPLAIPGEIDVVALIGPKTGAQLSIPAPGDYQRFVYVATAAQDIIRKVDVVTIL